LKTLDLLVATLAVVVVLSLGSVWFYPSVQDFMEGNTMWNGVRDFTDKFNVKNIDSLDEISAQPENTVMVSIPYMEYNPDDLSRVNDFVNSGGHLIIMDDFGFGNSILENLGLKMRFDGRELLDPLFCYKNPNLPRITDFSSALKETGIEAVAFNHGTILTNVDNSAPIAWSSDKSFLDANSDGAFNNGEPTGPFIVGARVNLGKGRVDIISDPSLIINSMTDKNDNDKFVNYLIHDYGQPDNIVLDRSHLSKSPLDTSKMRLNTARAILSNPYVLVGIVAVVFVIITRYTYKRGENR
jgi:hypothetical protein